MERMDTAEGTEKNICTRTNEAASGSTTAPSACPEGLETIIDAGRAGSRLDALVRDLASLSLRAGRRLVADGRVLVNGQRKKPGYRALAGDHIRLVPQKECQERHDGLENLEKAADSDPAGQAASSGPAASAPPGRLLGRTDSYVWFFKPSLLHTVRLAGRSNASLEGQIPQLLAGDTACAGLQLLQRLDYETSGIVTAALTQERALHFREEEARGSVVKKYVCLVCGSLEGTVTVRNRLVAGGRTHMRALAQEDSDPARWTTLVPLLGGRAAEIFGDAGACPEAWADQELTLAGCLLHRGARHQIRVHAACTGHPLLWDGLYGTGRDGAHFFLHHGRLIHDGGDMLLLPDWPLAAQALRVMREWFALT